MTMRRETGSHDASHGAGSDHGVGIGWGRAGARRRLLALGALLSLACLEPADARPGLRLGGEPVPQSVTDWSFTRPVREIYLETRTPYFIPHSVTVVCADGDGELFIGARNPREKRWVRWVERDPEVRLQIEGRVYEVRLERVNEAPELERVRGAYAEKLGRSMDVVSGGQDQPEIWYWRVAPREG